MSRCIQTSCSCTGYKEPAQKSTLLQFRLSCQECGHQASEHRKLTAVDQLVKSEVAAGKRSKCTASILPSEVPLSPVFGRYDLIPLPRDDSSYTPTTEGGVQCTCRGFKTPDIIRLCQKFRTHLVNDAMAELKITPCSYCAHPLSSHITVTEKDGGSKESSIYSTRKPVLGVFESLALTNSSLLPFPPVNSECLEVILPTTSTNNFSLLSIGSFQDSPVLRLAVASLVLKSKSSDVYSPTDTVEAQSSGDDFVTASGPTNRKRMRRKQASPLLSKNQRRSTRLATRKVREEEKKILKQLKGLKGISQYSAMDVLDSDDEMDMAEIDIEQVAANTSGFIKDTEPQENYQMFDLPQELSDADVASHPVMAALRIGDSFRGDSVGENMDTGSQDAADVCADTGILVAMSAKESVDIFLSVISSSSKGRLHWHCIRYTGEGTLECMVLWEVADWQNEVLVATGMSSGVVCVWKAVLSEGRLEDTVPVTQLDCGSQCVVLSCSPCNKVLVAGTELGEAVFYSLPVDSNGRDAGVAQTVKCCSAPIQCITWSHDGRLVAVGACDDTIQVLQCPEPHHQQPVHKGSILNYLKRTEVSRQSKFVHTHTLKGHSSFIADMKFTHGRFLVSLGWDGQLLFWRHLTQQILNHGRQHSRMERSRIKPELVEPVGGYKVGPSPVVEFLPTMLLSLKGGGLLVTMANKMGGVSVAGYAKQNYSC